MEKVNNIGEEILSHYENFLGVFKNNRVFETNKLMPSLQFLEYDNVFSGCKVYTSLGVSKYQHSIQNLCEVVMAVDDDFDNCCTILANVLFYIINHNMNFGRGTYIEGISSINKKFADEHGKEAIYFTETYVFPDDFSKVNDKVKLYLAFFITKEECDYIKKNGCEKFEDYLESIECDIMNLNR